MNRPIHIRDTKRERAVHLVVNGERRAALASTSTTLLEFLRYQLGLTGSKQGCDKGDCGACTVLVEGEPVLACLTLASRTEGKEVSTVEGLRRPDGLHPLQRAFVDLNAAQCGFCTPGMLMSAMHFLDEREPGSPVSRDAVAFALSGNLCRCTGYVKILDAVVRAAKELDQELDDQAAS